MKHSRRIASMGIITVFLLLIFDSKTAFVGASQGVQLCVATVIPSLFPFFLICSMLTASLGNMTLPFLRPLGKRLGIAQGAESLFLIGLLGGYPVGAQSIAQACKAGTLSKQDGERMLAFSSNAGPAFLFGIGSGLFTKKWICWLLWGIHILAALVVALLTCNGQRSRSSSSFAENSLSLSACMQRSVKSMAIVCGWIIVFRTLICFLPSLVSMAAPPQLSVAGHWTSGIDQRHLRVKGNCL